MTGVRQRWVLDVALKHESDKCLLAPFSGIPAGYVQVRWNGRKDYIHRIVCEAKHGPCPPGMETLHSCHKRACANKRHVSWGTDAANQHARRAAGTHYEGEQMPWTKLTTAEVLAIRMAPRYHGSGKALAEQYGVSRPTITLIRQGKTWRHLCA